jgi:bacterioferritin-associated ferredoxin
MYICLCNGLTGRDVREHSAGEACSVAMVYRALGVKPQCGKCVPFVRQMLARYRCHSFLSGRRGVNLTISSRSRLASRYKVILPSYQGGDRAR